MHGFYQAVNKKALRYDSRGRSRVFARHEMTDARDDLYSNVMFPKFLLVVVRQRLLAEDRNTSSSLQFFLLNIPACPAPFFSKSRMICSVLLLMAL